ncbi:MAG: hypothetical protein KF681_11960 [Bdellovibrionaceae bacterium]|nr:hypothetical protein [Pseudobdellovibrionaceae bacterium]
MSVQLFVTPRQHFEELVEAGCERLQIKTAPAVQFYLVNLLEFYLDTRNLFPEENAISGQRSAPTMAEMWLKAGSLEGQQRFELLKQLGDRSLYISGFFSDSLQRKVVDVDYYADMGGAAYASLAESVREDTTAQVYRVFAKHFAQFADVLSFISRKSMVQTDENLLRLYDHYLQTGSEIARERLTELGVVTLPVDLSKKSRQ